MFLAAFPAALMLILPRATKRWGAQIQANKPEPTTARHVKGCRLEARTPPRAGD